MPLHNRSDHSLFISAQAANEEELKLDELAFRWALNEDPMANDKLAEGIRNFAKDARILEQLIAEKL